MSLLFPANCAVACGASRHRLDATVTGNSTWCTLVGLRQPMGAKGVACRPSLQVESFHQRANGMSDFGITIQAVKYLEVSEQNISVDKQHSIDGK